VGVGRGGREREREEGTIQARLSALPALTRNIPD